MSLVVVEPGLLTLVQDRGRRGWAHLGVPRAGALDAAAADLANRLVGNPPGHAVLEVTAGGLVLRAEQAHTVAVTGAPCPVTVAGRAADWGEPVGVPGGAEVALGPPRWGVRCYLAVAGGIDVDLVLGSRATDTLAGVGPPRPEVGTVLPVGPDRGVAAGVDVVVARQPRPVLRLLPGPHVDWFDGDVGARLDRSAYTVGARSNRVGLRLEGDPVPRREGELTSEPMVLGAVQVPPSGQPVVFLHDHPTTGGYPVVAVLHANDLGVAAQAAPGDRLTLRWVAAPA